MTWNFADSFDLYSSSQSGADMANGFWDTASGTTIGSFTAGRFTGSKCFTFNNGAYLTKVASENNAVHHIVCSFQQTNSISGTTNETYFEFFDGTTAQCSIVFQSGGNIVLTSGGPGGTVLATYAGAAPVSNTWYAFEFEVVIHNTVGLFSVRKNGNTSTDFTATGLNTRNSSNNYANKLQVGSAAGNYQYIDDMYWRSDASSVDWLGDIRCFTRVPLADVSVSFSQAPTSVSQTVSSSGGNGTVSAFNVRAVPFVATATGSVGSGTVNVQAGGTGNAKFAIYDSTGALLATSNALVNPVTGLNTFTFSSPIALVKGNTYYMAYDGDATFGFYYSSGSSNKTATVAYGSFPPSTMTGWTTGSANVPNITVIYNPLQNASLVNEAQEDTAASYVYSSTVGDSDTYSLTPMPFTPLYVISTVTRAYAIKSDAGSRTFATQMNSGGMTVLSSAITLTTSNWMWAWRLDVNDPNTGAAWVPSALNTVTIGPKVVS